MRAIHDAHAPGTDALEEPVVAKGPADQTIVFRNDRPSSNSAGECGQRSVIVHVRRTKPASSSDLCAERKNTGSLTPLTMNEKKLNLPCNWTPA